MDSSDAQMPSPDLLEDRPRTFARVIAEAAAWGERSHTFLQPDGPPRHLSFAQLEAEARRRYRHLSARGLKQGDRVALVIPDGDDFVVSFLACLYGGLVPVPLYPPLSFGKLDAYVRATVQILKSARPRLLVTTSRMQHVLWSLVDEVPGLEALVCSDQLAGPGTGSDPDPDRVQPGDPAFLQFTSGSTSMPKGVIVTHSSLVANTAAIMRDTLQSTLADRGVSWLPLYHDMGLIGFVLAPLRYLVQVTFIPTLSFVRRPPLWMDTIHEARGTITFAPNFAFALATRRVTEEKLGGLDLSCLRAVGCGAEPNHGETLRAFAERFSMAGLRPESLLPCYGMAEATLAMSFTPLREVFTSDLIDRDAYHDRAMAIPVELSEDSGGRSCLEFVSCGYPIPGHRVRIVDEAGRDLPDRCIGEIVFSGPSVAGGYFEQPEASTSAFTDAGLHTGDLGYLAEGELFVTGRKKDLIILNGRNYDPQTLEWTAAQVEGLRKGSVAAFSRTGESTEELVLVAETRVAPEARAALAQELVRHIQSQHFVPVADVVLLEPGELPKTTSGKLQRARCRQQYLDGKLGREGNRTMGDQGETLTVARQVARSLFSRVKHSVRAGASNLRERLAAGKNPRDEESP